MENNQELEKELEETVETEEVAEETVEAEAAEEVVEETAEEVAEDSEEADEKKGFFGKKKDHRCFGGCSDSLCSAQRHAHCGLLSQIQPAY